MFKTMVIKIVCGTGRSLGLQINGTEQSEIDAHLHGQLKWRGKGGKTESLVTYTSLRILTFSELCFLFLHMSIISSQMTPQSTYPAIISEQITLIAPTFPLACCIITSIPLCQNLISISPSDGLCPLSASGCTGSKADSSCPCTLIAPHHVLLQTSLAFLLLSAVGFLIQIPMNCKHFLTSLQPPSQFSFNPFCILLITPIFLNL